MIKININTNGRKVLDSFHKEETNLEEVAVTLLKLEQIKKVLIDLEFEDEFKMVY